MKLYTIDCTPDCAFKVRSHKKDEAKMIAIKHVKDEHGKTYSMDEVESMVKESEN